MSFTRLSTPAIALIAALAGIALVASIAFAAPTGDHDHWPMMEPAAASQGHEHCPLMEPGAAGRPGAPPAGTLPRLSGQDAFGAIQEIVALLDADPTSDWSSIDVGALRDHLVDMNELVLNTQVSETPVEGGFAATLTGTGRTLGAIRRMVPMHASMLGMDEPGLKSTWKETAGGGVLTVTAVDPAGVARLRALGFYGVMTLGDHHRRHHLGIATGGMRH